MSQYPSDEKVKALLVTIENLIAIDHQVTSLQNQIQALNSSLEVGKTAQAKFVQLIPKLLEEMDCRSSGNFGYENRIITMLTKLISTHTGQS